MPIVALTAFVAGLLAVVGLLAYVARKTQAREAIWRTFAETRGGTFHASRGGLLSARAASIEVPAAGVPVLLDTFVVSTGKSSTMYTRARASFAIGDGPVFRVYREGLLSSVGKALGTQDVELGGHARFDATFMVKCDAPEAVRRLWTMPLRDATCSSLEHATVSSDGTIVTTTVLGAVDDAAGLGALADLTGGLASAGLGALAALAAELPSARYTTPSGTWDARSRPRIDLDERGVAMTIEVQATDEGWQVELAARSTRTLPVLAVSFDEAGTVIGEVPPGLLPTASELAVLGPSGLTSTESSLQLRFAPGRAPSRTAAEAAIALLRSLARAPGDAFR